VSRVIAELPAAERAFLARPHAGLEVSRHGLAGHHSPEDRPEELAAAISAWADRHGLANR